MLRDVINLYLPAPPSSKYSAKWETHELGMAGRLGDMVNKIGSIDSLNVAEIMGKIGSESKGALKHAVLSTVQEAKVPVLGDVGGSIASAIAMTANPFKTQLFNSMGLRVFQFDFKMMPRSKVEYLEVQKIVKTLGKERWTEILHDLERAGLLPLDTVWVHRVHQRDPGPLGQLARDPQRVVDAVTACVRDRDAVSARIAAALPAVRAKSALNFTVIDRAAPSASVLSSSLSTAAVPVRRTRTPWSGVRCSALTACLAWESLTALAAAFSAFR